MIMILQQHFCILFINKSNPNFEEVRHSKKPCKLATPALNKIQSNLFNLDIKTYVDPNSSRIYVQII